MSDLEAIAEDIQMAARSPEMARHVALDHGPELLEELAGARKTIAHMSEAMSWISGHDRTGHDHMVDAMHLADKLDAIRKAHSEYEQALAERQHGAVAADRFIRAVVANLEVEP